MGTKKTDGLAARLEGVRGRFERWRRTRKVGTRIPESLWNAAVRMAGEYGVNRTAKTLRVNYYALKKRTEREAAVADKADAGGTAAPFIELAPCDFPADLRASTFQCMLELEDCGRAKMRVHLKGASAAEVAAIGCSLWRVEP